MVLQGGGSYERGTSVPVQGLLANRCKHRLSDGPMLLGLTLPKDPYDGACSRVTPAEGYLTPKKHTLSLGSPYGP